MGRGVGGRIEGTPTWLILVLLLSMTACVRDLAVPEWSDGPRHVVPLDEIEPGDTGSGSPVVGRVTINRQSDRVLEDIHITNPGGDCLHVTDSVRIVVRNVTIGPCGGRAILIERSEGVTVEGSSISGSQAGIYALRSTGVVVIASQFDDAGRNPIQFDKVTGEGNQIVGNLIVNLAGSQSTEDSINVYSSGGTADSPLVVENNFIRNGGSSDTGSGILVGDKGGSHTMVRDNILINPGQAGIGVAGGRDITVVGNLVFSESHPWTNVGIYVWDQYDSDCGDIRVAENVVEWYDRNGEDNRLYDGGNCGPVEGWDENESATGLGDQLLEWEPVGPGSW